MATLFVPFFVAVDGNGLVRANAKLYFYTTGTTTPATTYNNSDLAGGHENANPVVADANGLFGSIYLDGSTVYKAVLKDEDDNTIATRDPISSLTSAAVTDALGYTPGNSTGSASAYLGADVLLNNTGTFFNGPNTGAIGADGQTWLLISQATAYDTAGAATFSCLLHDGTNPVATGAGATGGANFSTTITFAKVIALTGPTTFTLKVKDVTSTSGILTKTTDVTATGLATSITAVRLS